MLIDDDRAIHAEPDRAEDGRLMYYEHQVQRSERYDGLLADWPIDRARLILPELFFYADLYNLSDFPLPPAGLPGHLRSAYSLDEPAAELIAISMGYLNSIISNERRAMHNRWDAAREFIRKIEDRTEERIRAALAKRDREFLERQTAAQLVYFIASASGPIKIGIAVNPDARLKGLQTGHHEKLELLATCAGGQPQEHAYHEMFAAHRLNGEWFERCPEIEAEIDRLNAPNLKDNSHG